MTHQDRERIARQKYEAAIKSLDGHHCPAWEGLSEMMRQHLISLVKDDSERD
jgi:hypothetical protein